MIQKCKRDSLSFAYGKKSILGLKKCTVISTLAKEYSTSLLRE